jgi:carbonic anhydrase
VPRLITIDRLADIPGPYRRTPIGRLLEYHNLGRRQQRYSKAQLLVGMCMDSRKHLRIPDNFAFIIRAGGANLRHSEFKVSYAIGVGGVSCIALIGHNHCGMVNLESRKRLFVRGLMKRGGWTRTDAEQHFRKLSATFEIGNEINFVLSVVKRLRLRYPKVTVAPMLYKVEDNRLYVLSER